MRWSYCPEIRRTITAAEFDYPDALARAGSSRKIVQRRRSGYGATRIRCSRRTSGTVPTRRCCTMRAVAAEAASRRVDPFWATDTATSSNGRAAPTTTLSHPTTAFRFRVRRRPKRRDTDRRTTVRESDIKLCPAFLLRDRGEKEPFHVNHHPPPPLDGACGRSRQEASH